MFRIETALLWEDDLDAPVLRLAYAWRGWYARIVHAASGDGHIAARHALRRQSVGHCVCAPLGQALVVTSGTRQVCVTRHLDPHRAARLVLLRCERDDLLALRVMLYLSQSKNTRKTFCGGGGGGAGGSGGGGAPNFIVMLAKRLFELYLLVKLPPAHNS